MTRWRGYITSVITHHADCETPWCVLMTCAPPVNRSPLKHQCQRKWPCSHLSNPPGPKISLVFRDRCKSQQDTAGAENPVLLSDTDPESETCFTASLDSSSPPSVAHEWMIVMSHASSSTAQESGRRPSAKRLVGYAQRWAQGTRKAGCEEAQTQRSESGRSNSDDGNRH